MPDKRDMHQAKSHRNSRKQQGSSPADRGAQRPPTAGAPTSMAVPDEVTDPTLTPAGKKNKSRR